MTSLRRRSVVLVSVLLLGPVFPPGTAALAQDTSGSSLGSAAGPTPGSKPQAVVPKPAHPRARATVPAKHATPVLHPPKSSHAQRTAKPAPAVAAPPAPAPTEVPPLPAEVEQPGKGSVTGLPLPRYAALRSDEVNLRTGPGTRYPIDWVYHRRDLPVQIEREFEVWRLISDPDGIKGWVHQATLTGRRSFIVRDSDQTLRSGPRDDADAVARMKPGVIGRLRSCAGDAEWCEVQVGDYRGYVKRFQIWGLAPAEAIN